MGKMKELHIKVMNGDKLTEIEKSVVKGMINCKPSKKETK